jgi:hypothetical protein
MSNQGSIAVNQKLDLYQYNPVYSRQSNIFIAPSKTLLESDNKVFDHDIMPSAVKKSGEVIDSWLNFFAASSLTVEGAYGPISSLRVFNDFLMFFQETGIGVASVNQRELHVPDETGASLILGKGGILDDYKYVSRTVGCSHPFSIQIIDFPESMMLFYSYNTNRIFYYASNKASITARNEMIPLSTISGMNSELDNFDTAQISYGRNLHNTVHGAFDLDNSRVLFTFLPDNIGQSAATTLAFNSTLNQFELFCPYTPRLFFNIGKSLISVANDSQSTCWIYGYGSPGQFFGTYYPSRVTFVINTIPEMEKLFNTLSYNLSVFTNYDSIRTNTSDVFNRNFDQIRIYNEYQDSGYVNLSTLNSKRLMRVWHVVLPRPSNAVGTERIRSQTAIVELVFNHDSRNQRFILENVLSKMTLRP